MHRMSVVRGQKKAVLIKPALPEPVFCPDRRFPEQFQKPLQKRGICALLRPASTSSLSNRAYTLINLFRLRCQKSVRRRIAHYPDRPDAESRSGIVRSHDAPFIPVIHIQIAAKNLLFRHACRFCAQLFDRKLLIQPPSAVPCLSADCMQSHC